jgi:hypothetical protein
VNFTKLLMNWNENSGFIARATWLFSVNLPLQPFFDKEKSIGDNSPLGLEVLRFGSCPIQVG